MFLKCHDFNHYSKLQSVMIFVIHDRFRFLKSSQPLNLKKTILLVFLFEYSDVINRNRNMPYQNQQVHESSQSLRSLVYGYHFLSSIFAYIIRGQPSFGVAATGRPQ